MEYTAISPTSTRPAIIQTLKSRAEFNTTHIRCKLTAFMLVMGALRWVFPPHYLGYILKNLSSEIRTMAKVSSPPTQFIKRRGILKSSTKPIATSPLKRRYELHGNPYTMDARCDLKLISSSIELAWSQRTAMYSRIRKNISI